MGLGNRDLHRAIIRMLEEAGVSHRRLVHAPAHTSEQSAAFRNEPLSIGGKSLLLMVDGQFQLFVISAALRIDNLAVRRRFGTRRTRFATLEELDRLTGLLPGCVPPFGPPILPFPMYADESVLTNDRIGFNAALLTESVIMRTEDWLALARPAEVFRFSRQA